MSLTIPLGSEKRVSQLYSFPNSPACPWTLGETVKHWFDMTLERDGLAAKGARASVSSGKDGCVLTLDGPDAVQADLQRYAVRLPRFLANGWAALSKTVPRIKADGRWDPSPDPEPPPYHPWRSFLPHGMAMLNQRAVLFFHYPPIRLLDTNQDYLDDPVPVRCEELLTANGAAASDLPLFNTVMDATPIGAEDSQGSKKAGDPTWGLIPIQDFHDYQRAQVELLLNPSDHAGFTVPIVVYGAHPLATFNELYGTSLKNNQVTVAEIVKGSRTPIMASTHPYVFYGTAQGFDAIGSGKLVNEKGATAQMIKDLVVARWLKLMSDDPSQDPAAVLAHAQQYWSDPGQAAVVEALVRHQGSLYYSDPTTLAFEFLVPLPTLGRPQPAMAAQLPAAAAVSPATDRAAAPPKAAVQTPAKTPAAASAAKAPAPAAVKTSVKSAAKPPAVAGSAKASSKAAPAVGTSRSSGKVPSTVNATTVIGDSGKPVDWWFIYKMSGNAQTTSRRPVTGAEYVYFDSVMAGKGDAGLVLSPNRIDHAGALVDTLGKIFTPAAKACRSLGWYCYNDEDHRDHRNKGTGPEDRGHCKGTLAFDPATDTGFWLIHSVPLFPLPTDFAYPDSGLEMGQTMLCIQLADATTAMHIAQLMYDAHGPNVHLASDLLQKTKKQLYGYAPSALPLTDVPKLLGADDARVRLMQNLNGSTGRKPVPYSGRVPFRSQGGQDFLAIAKNKAWGDAEDDPAGAKDFYDDLVGPALNEDIEVETWENAKGKIPLEVEHGESHKVENMMSVNLAPLGIPYSWSETSDHAKLAISDRTNPPGSDRWICVGDINFTLSMEKRGGGTVAFKCESLWNSLVQVLSDKAEPATSKTTPKRAGTRKLEAGTGPSEGAQPTL